MKDFVPTPRRLIEEAETSAHIAVFAAIAWHRNRNGLAMPGILRVANMARVSKPTAITSIKWLWDHKFLEISQRDGHRQAFSYRFPDLDETGQNEIPVNNETGSSSLPLYDETGQNEIPEPVKNKHPNKTLKNKRLTRLLTPIADAVVVPAAISIPLRDGSEFGISQGEVDEWSGLFPLVDVPQQLRSYRAWALAKPTKRKTRSGIKSSITSWLSDKQDNPRNREGAPKRGARAENFDLIDFQKSYGLAPGENVGRI